MDKEYLYAIEHPNSFKKLPFHYTYLFDKIGDINKALDSAPELQWFKV